MKVSIIAALGKNNEIGKNNDLIWHLPKDMKFFTETTTGHYVIMGRKNWDSIPEKYRPLKNRVNVVVTRQKDFKAENCIVVSSVEEGIELARFEGETECFIIGGGQIYAHSLEEDLVDRMYLTHISEGFEADTHFPKIDPEKWFCKGIMKHQKDDRNPYDFVIDQYDRRN
ncbi:MAG: dihydrofolate reductase [Flavobacteriales bacterium]|nr:dihydrofolate reductase [Flavobacteriales bacterium]MCB9196745.1 dihydrofolate reductase [Flavobacteriales bacterium]MCB9197722.1 dihydrofolate reductase [Flavobacteriales bacterium]